MAGPVRSPELEGKEGQTEQTAHSGLVQDVVHKQPLGGSAEEIDGSQTVTLTVRTLDKKEHRLSVVHDISVAALKDEVAAITSIDADSQVGACGARAAVCNFCLTRLRPPPLHPEAGGRYKVEIACSLPRSLRRAPRAHFTGFAKANTTHVFGSAWSHGVRRCHWTDGCRTTAPQSATPFTWS